jgi:hypothetical protein
MKETDIYKRFLYHEQKFKSLQRRLILLYIAAFGLLFIQVATWIETAKAETAFTAIEQEQAAFYKENGRYFSDTRQKDFEIHTYESVCKGYILVDKTQEDKIVYTGYGSLADEFTYEKILPINPVSATTSDESSDF